MWQQCWHFTFLQYVHSNKAVKYLYQVKQKVMQEVIGVSNLVCPQILLWCFFPIDDESQNMHVILQKIHDIIALIALSGLLAHPDNYNKGVVSTEPPLPTDLILK